MMDWTKIYSIGKRIPSFHVKKVDEKLKFILFPYNSKEILSTCLAVLIVCMFLAFGLSFITKFFLYAFFFLGIILAIALYIYPTSIHYTKQIIDYKEEMLRAIMKISTYISMNSSLEYAMMHTKDELRGTLKLQFEDIFEKLRIKEKCTLGGAIENYIAVWNENNPEFVKALKLLQTASMSPPKERNTIIEEVLETIILAYHESGKRFAEKLASQAKTLIAVGVLLPIISLMILPLLSIFMPHVVQPPVIAFVYNVFFPAILLVMALHFASSRIQVNTIRIEDAPEYKQVPWWLYAAGAAIILLFAIPTIMHLKTINLSILETAAREYALGSVFICWLIGLGIILAIYLYAYYHTKMYKKLWQDVYDTEQDFPHLLQIFSTYLNLNRSIESILPDVVDDYETHGFKDHPVVNVFRKMFQKLRTTKKSIKELTRKILPKICPSKKVSNNIYQIISFTDVSQGSAGRAAKMMRKQTLSIFQLDDYIKSLLAETVSLINITVTMLAPLLSAAAVIMSLAIVMSLRFITQQLEIIQNSLGVTQGTALNLVDITQIIPPTVIEVVVSIYLIEMMLVLSIFASNIKIGNDKYQTIKAMKSNLMGFAIYTAILFVGFILFRNFVFQGVLA